MKAKTEISPRCEICEIGKTAPDGKTMLCIKHGIVPINYVCSSFEYDPLKRKPTLPKKQTFDKKDFEI